ncbi:hypothetical protein OI73_05475 [Pantoea stewartii]|nr:hypothetical protein OI73_05475 [Pantoea stewartii]
MKKLADIRPGCAGEPSACPLDFGVYVEAGSRRFVPCLRHLSYQRQGVIAGKDRPERKLPPFRQKGAAKCVNADK